MKMENRGDRRIDVGGSKKEEVGKKDGVLKEEGERKKMSRTIEAG